VVYGFSPYLFVGLGGGGGYCVSGFMTPCQVKRGLSLGGLEKGEGKAGKVWPIARQIAKTASRSGNRAMEVGKKSRTDLKLIR